MTEGAPEREVILKNGEPSFGVAPVMLSSPAWRLGQSLFETLLVRPSVDNSKPSGRDGLHSHPRLQRTGGNGSGLRFPEEHVQRLVDSCRRMGWQGCPQFETLLDWVLKGAARYRDLCPGEYGRLRLTVAWTREERHPDTYVHVIAYSPPRGPAHVVTTPVRIPWSHSAGATKVGSRHIYSLAEAYADEVGADEALLVDEEGNPVEGAKSNLFAVVSGTIVTPSVASGVLPGVTREQVITRAKKSGITVVEETIRRVDLESAEAVFLTNALWGVRIVRRIDHNDYPVDHAMVDGLRRAIC